MPSPKRIWRIKELLDSSVEYLKEKEFESPRLECEWLLSHSLGLKRIDLYLQFDRSLKQEETDRYKALLKERLGRKPLQYIIGRAEFMGLEMVVGEGVLIPRPETEQLTEIGIELLKGADVKGAKVLDVCTGCGNIAIAIAKLLEESRVSGIDSSQEALNYAEKNSEICEVSGRIEFHITDLLKEDLPGTGYHLIISNPPYVPSKLVSGSRAQRSTVVRTGSSS